MSNIKDLSKKILDGEVSGKVDILGIVKNAEVKTYGTFPNIGERYVFDMTDAGGSISTSIFADKQTGEIPSYVFESFKSGNIVNITNVNTSTFAGNAQFSISKDSEITILSPEDVNMIELDLDLAGQVSELKERFENVINSIESEEVLSYINWVTNKEWFKNNFYKHPAAAKVHHAQEKGLALHTVAMMEKAQFMVDSFDLNNDLLIAGAFTHDLGKIWEMDMNDDGTGSYSRDSLIGHIVLSSDIVRDAFIDGVITEEFYMQLRHMVLSHHGKLEWGSPVVPATKEAAFLHYIDQLDAAAYQFEVANYSLDEGEISTERVWALGAQPYRGAPLSSKGKSDGSALDMLNDHYNKSIDKEPERELSPLERLFKES